MKFVKFPKKSWVEEYEGAKQMRSTSVSSSKSIVPQAKLPKGRISASLLSTFCVCTILSFHLLVASLSFPISWLDIAWISWNSEDGYKNPLMIFMCPISGQSKYQRGPCEVFWEIEQKELCGIWIKCIRIELFCVVVVLRLFLVHWCKLLCLDDCYLKPPKTICIGIIFQSYVWVTTLHILVLIAKMFSFFSFLKEIINPWIFTKSPTL